MLSVQNDVFLCLAFLAFLIEKPASQAAPLLFVSLNSLVHIGAEVERAHPNSQLVHDMIGSELTCK